MSKNAMQFKFWDQSRKSRKTNLHTDTSSSTVTEQEARKQPGNDGAIKWNYVAFTPSDDPKHNNGTKATVLRSNTLRSESPRSKPGSRNSSKSGSQRSRTKRRRIPSFSSSDSDESGIAKTKRACAYPNSSCRTIMPLLRETFQLKYMLEGHSHLSQQTQPKRQKKSVSSKQKSVKSKKKESSSKRRGRGRQHQDNGDSDDDDDGGDDDGSDDDNDDSLDIWACEFEPSKDIPSTIVALCGGSSILFLDAHQGRYVKKYAHPEPLECFYTLAWTLLRGSRQLGRNTTNVEDGKNNNSEDDEDDDTCAAILAAAGKFGSIKLLDPTQTHCYRYLFGHQQSVLKLNFSKSEPRWLLSSSMDMTVRLWDIGTPTNEHDNSSCLAHFTVPGTGHPTSMSLSYDLSLLVVGKNNADLLQYAVYQSDIKKWRRDTHKANHTSDVNEDDNEKSKPTIIKPKSKFPHGEEWHDGYVEDVYILGQDGAEDDISNYAVSRGSNDMEILLWNPMTSTKTDADIHLSLEWPDSDDCTGMRFSIMEKDGQKLLLGGDHDGDIRLYNIGDGKCSKTLEDGSKELFQPMKVFSHESSTSLIRDVCISLDTRKFVAVDSDNTVFVWTCD
ncbi:WD40-repeat-containing domain protein [Absidia repens]|uniref:WD40-repeat-containing domain protein n=1 Tax=Absidia repens TaxID=90262 RepID=A0A1X2I7H1_9FUNG|nr:WD40-repeat-containing domain protein [Absidia repens]